MSSRRAEIRIDASIVCDDIRQEKNDKFIFIGVYSDAIESTQIPITLPRLGIGLRARILAPGSAAFQTTLQDPNGGMVFDVRGDINYEGEPGHATWIVLISPPVILPVDGVYPLRAFVDGEPVFNDHVRVVRRPPRVEQQPASPSRPN